MPTRPRAILYLIGTFTIWGVTFPLIKYTLDYIPPISFLFFRYLVASLIIFPLFLRNIKKQPINHSDLPKLMATGLLGPTLSILLLFYGLQYTSSIEGVILHSIFPIFTILAGVVFLKEVVNKFEKVGIFIILMGIVLTFPLLSLRDNSLSIFGDILLILSGMGWAGFSILSKEMFHKYQPLTVLSFSFFVTLFCFTPLFLWEAFTVYPETTVNLYKASYGILGMGIFGSVIAYILYEKALEIIDASEAVVFGYLSPVIAIPVAVIFLSERISTNQIIGGIIIIAGIFISEYGSHLQRRKNIKRPYLKRHKV